MNCIYHFYRQYILEKIFLADLPSCYHCSGTSNILVGGSDKHSNSAILSLVYHRFYVLFVYYSTSITQLLHKGPGFATDYIL